MCGQKQKKIKKKRTCIGLRLKQLFKKMQIQLNEAELIVGLICLATQKYQSIPYTTVKHQFNLY